MNKYSYPEVGETVYRKTLPNGLQVAVVPKPGFSRKLAYFMTHYGSIYTRFEWEGREYQVPDGVAHFLEHKMFDLPGRDVSAEFAALGASVNAFTSFDLTAYYFSCTEHFEENLKLLLEFVSTPYFTEESVQKEWGIIDQEIGMYADTPDSQEYEHLMAALYEHHPARKPILGTSETIRQITPEILYTTHRAFYTPGNMMLCVVGDVDPEEVADIASAMLPKEYRSVGKKLPMPKEQMERLTPAVTVRMDVSMPSFTLGFRCEPEAEGEAVFRQEVVGDLAAEVLFGESSPLYLKLYEQGLIDSSFGGGFEDMDGCATLVCCGDSDSPEAVREAILEEAQRLVQEGIDEKTFLRIKRGAMGRRIRELDSFDSTCFRLCAYQLTDFDYFRFPALYQQAEAREICDFLKKVVTEERCGLSTVYPISQEES